MPDELNHENAFTQAIPEPQEVTPQATPEAPSQPSELFTRAREAGLPLDGISSDSDLAKAVLDAYISNRPYADYGKQGLSQPQAQTEPKAAEPKQEEFDPEKYLGEAWRLPELSSGAQWALKSGAFEEDERGMLVPVKGLEQAALPYVKELNDYQRSRASLNETFASNPVKFMAEKLMPYFNHHFTNQFKSHSQESLSAFEQQAFVSDFRKENASWMYTPDGRAFTEQGQKFSGLVDHWMGKGLPLADAIEIAKSMAPPPAPQAQAESQAQPTDVGELAGRQRDEHGRLLPAGTPAPAEPTKQESFIERAKKNSTANASRGGGTPPVRQSVDSEGDLDSLFVVAGKKAFATA